MDVVLDRSAQLISQAVTTWLSCDDFDCMELAEACSGIPADFPAACVYLGSDSADPNTPRCQAIAVAAKCRAADLRRKIDIVNRRLVRREANVGRSEQSHAWNRS